GVRADVARAQIADHDSLGPTALDNQVEHLAMRVQDDVSLADLARQGLVRAKQELLASLSTAVERARHLRSTEGTIVEQSAILARKGHALRHALINDAGTDLGEAIDIRLARAEVAPLDGVVEQAPDAIAIVLIVLGRVDAALGGD